MHASSDYTYSTVEVSRLLGVTRQTVSHWVDQGKLRGYKTPGGHRKILHEELVNFCHRFGMPVPKTLVEVSGSAPSLIYIVANHAQLANQIQGILTKHVDGLTVDIFPGIYQALLACGKRAPNLLCVTSNMPNLEFQALQTALQSFSGTGKTQMVVVRENDAETTIAENVRNALA